MWTPGLLKSHGFRYDSSLMGNDVPYDVATPEGPLTEIPVQWIMDDAPLFRHVYGATNAIADPGRVLQMWSAEFVAMHRENGCFVLTCHPFISGRASRVALIEELVAYMRRQRGVWFATRRGGGPLARRARTVGIAPGAAGAAPPSGARSAPGAEAPAPADAGGAAGRDPAASRQLAGS